MRILIVEDEARLANLLRRALGEEGHAVDLAADGEEALAWVDVGAYDAIVLDVMLPGIDGLEICRQLRQRRVRTPILLLTARDTVADRVRGLDAGGDDYLIKPFAFAELAARLRALARRPAETHDPVLAAGAVRLDPATRRVWRGEEEIVLPNKEFRILEYLLRHPDMVLTRTMIAEHVWDYDFPNVTNVIDVHIRQLRRRLRDPYPGGLIETVRGAGYRVTTQK
ncbi:MAG: response regulator transcription factor [Thermomicrobiales bacterium]